MATWSETYSQFASGAIKPQWACSATACAAWNRATNKTDPATKQLFEQLQAAINAGLKAAGHSTIKVDGLLGAGTVTAYNKVLAAWPVLKLGTGIVGGLVSVASKEALAERSLLIYSYLSSKGPSVFVTKPATTGSGSGGGSSKPPADAVDVTVPPPALPASQKISVWFAKNKWPVMGAFGVIAIGAFVLTDDKKAAKSKAVTPFDEEL